jgi:hypothetical protein
MHLNAQERASGGRVSVMRNEQPSAAPLNGILKAQAQMFDGFLR